MSRARLTVAISATAAAFALAGCGSSAWGMDTATDDSQHTEQIKNVRLDNGSGNITIRTGGATTTVHREVHYSHDKPGATHRVEGDTLVLEGCKTRGCRIDYEVSVP